VWEAAAVVLFDSPPSYCRFVLKSREKCPLLVELVGAHGRHHPGLLSTRGFAFWCLAHVPTCNTWKGTETWEYSKQQQQQQQQQQQHPSTPPPLPLCLTAHSHVCRCMKCISVWAVYFLTQGVGGVMTPISASRIEPSQLK